MRNIFEGLKVDNIHHAHMRWAHQHCHADYFFSHKGTLWKLFCGSLFVEAFLGANSVHFQHTLIYPQDLFLKL